MKSRLERKIDRAQVASFDVFDTAVLRKLDRPQSLFQLMVPDIVGVLGSRAPDFPSVRIHAEYEARRQAWMAEPAKKPVEVQLSQIYEIVGDILGLSAATAQDLSRHEIRAEIAVCYQNSFVHSLYRHCVEQCKTIVFISDMYLPKDVVGEILTNCGYSKYDALFVSSETGKTKASGELYDKALSSTPFRPKQWLHIGDNRQADVRMARKRGLAAWHLASSIHVLAKGDPRFEAWKAYRPSPPAGHVVKGLIANRLARPKSFQDISNSDQKFWEDFGYSTAGPLYTGFTEWLIEQIKKHELEAIYFLARDGYMIQRLFKMLRPPELASLDTHYLYASRRMLRFAAIRTFDNETLEFLTESFDPNEIGIFMQRIGLDPQLHVDAIKQAGFKSAHHVVKTRNEFERLRQLVKSLSNSICEQALSERSVILEYLENSGLVAGRRVALVDVGWRGYQQRSIQEILHAEGKVVHITGFYFGTFSNAKNFYGSELQHEAYLFKLGQPPEYEALTVSCTEISELLFSAPEASVLRMERTPIGDFVPVRQPIDADDALRNENVEQLQEGAMQFVADYLALKREFPDLAINPEIAINQLRRVLRDPTSCEAKHLGDIPHTKDFGDSARRPIAPRLSWFALLERRRLIRWLEGPWRPGIEARSSWLFRALYRMRMR
jgi:predicted HAD superfamily hydrolase